MKQGTSALRKHINASLTEIYSFSGENPYFMKNVKKKDIVYNLRISNLLTLPKINSKKFGLYLLF